MIKIDSNNFVVIYIFLKRFIITSWNTVNIAEDWLDSVGIPHREEEDHGLFSPKSKLYLYKEAVDRYGKTALDKKMAELDWQEDNNQNTPHSNDVGSGRSSAGKAYGTRILTTGWMYCYV